MKKKLVDVLLATCDGGRYLTELLDSILVQTYSDFRVLVSDDCSTDDTLAILERYRSKFGERLQLLSQRPRRVGGLRNFEYLMQSSLDSGQAQWAMFCDQDDVWLPYKIENSLAEMRCIESRRGSSEPCLVHTDLAVVDQNLKTIAHSFVRYQRMYLEHFPTLWMLSMNQVTGCASLMNRALLAAALPIPPEVVVHDWWCAVLSCSGQRMYIDEPTLLYRQHSGNQIGASNRSLFRRIVLSLEHGPGTVRRVLEAGRNSYLQAQALEARLKMLQWNSSDVSDYLAWRRKPLWQRVRHYRAYYPGPEVDRLIRCLLWIAPPEASGLWEKSVADISKKIG